MYLGNEVHQTCKLSGLLAGLEIEDLQRGLVVPIL